MSYYGDPPKVRVVRPDTGYQFTEEATQSGEKMMTDNSDALAVHEQKLTDLVSGVNLKAIEQWQKFRCETDEVMQTLREREEQILDLIAKLIADARASGAAVAIFSENLQRLQDEFRVQLPKASNLKPNGSGE